MLLENGNVRAARLLRSLLRFYVRHTPLRRGRELLVRQFHHYVAAPEGEILTKLDAETRVRVDLREHVQRSIYYFGLYEQQNVALVRRYVKPGMVMVDCGAFIGQYTLIGSRCVGSEGEVHSFEPTPNTFAALQRNIALNKLSNVYTNQIALSSATAAERHFYIASETNQASNSLAPTISLLEEASFVVAVTTLDTYFAGRSRLPDFMKLDVEGAELMVLKGAQHILKQARPLLILEASKENAEAFGYSLEEFVAQLREWGYDINVVGADGSTRPLVGTTADFQYWFCTPSR